MSAVVEDSRYVMVPFLWSCLQPKECILEHLILPVYYYYGATSVHPMQLDFLNRTLLVIWLLFSSIFDQKWHCSAVRS